MRFRLCRSYRCDEQVQDVRSSSIAFLTVQSRSPGRSPLYSLGRSSQRAASRTEIAPLREVAVGEKSSRNFSPYRSICLRNSIKSSRQVRHRNSWMTSPESVKYRVGELRMPL